VPRILELTRGSQASPLELKRHSLREREATQRGTDKGEEKEEATPAERAAKASRMQSDTALLLAAGVLHMQSLKNF
jgi:hypothetical protein